MKRVLAAMSGGVDSAVAALLLREAGWEVTGVTMRLFPGEDEANAADAKAVCDRIGIEFFAIDLRNRFRETVIEPFVNAYERGETPNPCVFCNKSLKFGALMELAEARGFDALATGHYARVRRVGDRWALLRAADPAKDQSYVLYGLTQALLPRVLFPLGEYSKGEVRKIAEARGFVSARRRESQDICFIPEGDYGAFLEEYTGKRYPPGDFLDERGRRLGTHRGAVRYTRGQRRGLDLPMGERVYVLGKDMARNTVTVGKNEALFSSTVTLAAVNLIPFPALPAPMEVTAKCRYRQEAQPALLSANPDGTHTLRFSSPQRAVTPGQAAVFYRGEEVIGGGTIVGTA